MHNVQRYVVFAMVLALPVFLVGCGGGGGEQQPAQQQQAQEPAGEGSLTVTVNFEGEAPQLEPYDSSGNPECRSDEVANETVVVNDNNTLKWSVVSIKSGPDGFAVDSPEDVTIDQDHCQYKPHVSAVKTGQQFTVTDSDPKLHNVRATTDGKQLFNKSTFEGQEFSESFSDPGVYHLECNVHPWMSAYVYVTDHGRSGVTGDQGEVTLNDLPAGDYEVTIWHQKYGTKSLSVTVEADQEASESVTFSA